VPGRSEPDTGEVDCGHLFVLIDRRGYRGRVGGEYRPARSGAGVTSAGLGWMRVVRMPYLRQSSIAGGPLRRSIAARGYGRQPAVLGGETQR
jgi:hypothetical protein